MSFEISRMTGNEAKIEAEMRKFETRKSKKKNRCQGARGNYYAAKGALSRLGGVGSGFGRLS